MSSSREPRPTDSPVPTLADVLAWCESAGPAGWYPADHATEGPAREAMYQHTMDLRRLGYIEVVEWVKVKGQGFTITDLGRQKLGRPLIVPGSGDSSRAFQGLTTYERGERARSDLIDPRPAVVAPALVIACLTWFAIGLYFAITAGTTTAYLASGDVPTLTRIGAAYGPKLYAGEWWRLGVSGFVHIGVLHLLLNGYGLYLSGSTAEALWGRWKFGLIFTASVLAGSALATALRPTSLLAGASGGIWGVLLSIVAWIVLHRRHLPPAWVREAAGRLGFAVLVNALASAIPGVSWEAHLGGALAGFFVAALLFSVRPGAGWWGRIAVIALVLGTLTVGVTYRRFVTTSGRWEPVRRQVELVAALANGTAVSQKLIAINHRSAAISVDRIQTLHKDGAVAVASGSVKKIAAVRQAAEQLRGEVETLVADFESLDETVLAPEQRDRIVENYRVLIAFTASVETALDDPNPAKAWPGTKEPLKRITDTFRDQPPSP